ncbi:CheY-P phosphatase CheC [Geotoga petraea]|jgi:chemotaxis protein CheC|uniref:Chemotaxis protein CheC n=1 Tax=Geotoga petraea TaxID=28234 RepID=A0A1G6K241_9BACT|nr:CheY-P phosphatase CheC [Geotoga petraea]MDK2946540.1 chemotaxis protein CheC [Geotoga sp.]TGG88398.1 chemotaxis protein CheC [Geotoga petraea]SDC25044.1 chemotaxis protein CheC [Geotoga petraea]
MSLYEKINKMHLDALKEFGNIGAGNAATSISMMLNKKTDINVPEVKLISLSDLWKIFKDPEEITAGAMIGVGGELDGAILFLMGTEDIKKVLEMMMLPKPEDLTELDEMNRSAIGELGNIMCSSYVVSLSQFTNLNIHSLPPKVVVDMIAAIVSEVSLITTDGSDYLILIETNMSVEDFEKEISGYIIYIPDEASLNKILKTMGLGIDEE